MIIIIPIALSAFTHLWNPIGFPTIYIDEDHYLRRASQVMEGQGPQESSSIYDHPYDHPYIGQIFLASMLKLTDYKVPTNQSFESLEAIQQLYTLPRLIMGILAVIDTFLVYKIGEVWNGRKVGFVSAVLFAVMPLTWMLKMVLLDSLLLPFFLASVFLALYSGKMKSSKVSYSKILVILSGITLGLAIFTKVPIITFIPMIGFLIFRHQRSFKVLGIWLVPVLLIPLIWPAYIIYSGNFENGLDGILYQVERGERNFDDTIVFLLQADPVLIILGIVGGLAITLIKRDLIFLLWVIPYFLFIAYVGGIVKYFHFIELLPIFSISAGFIIVIVSNKISLIIKKREGNNKLPNIISISLIAGIGIFGLISTLILIGINTNETFLSFLHSYQIMLHPTLIPMIKLL